MQQVKYTPSEHAAHKIDLINRKRAKKNRAWDGLFSQKALNHFRNRLTAVD